MTAAELRTLLERVDQHGGPVAVNGNLILPRVGSWAFAFEPSHLDLQLVRDFILVGVLKRDLETKGHQWVTSWGTWANGTVAHGATVETGYRKSVTERGDTELEVVLRAWLAAAEAEGWTP